MEKVQRLSRKGVHLSEWKCEISFGEDEIAVMALRGGDIVGRHTVGLYNDGEFLELNHTATARNTFSKGAIKVAKWIVGKDARLYSINDALGL